ncbi:hypothetical protein Hamer_G004110 [Homarus americanus]|uniref:Uncharacterized protein n=1 Tax=Homarus americanus TaxID=6706 RepID=A0A8J5JL43_HOMAM|nr:hypothetical protein Hamer_G004110 [Homarus americanus]
MGPIIPVNWSVCKREERVRRRQQNQEKSINTRDLSVAPPAHQLLWGHHKSYPPEEEEVGVVVDPVIAQALLQLLSPPALGRRSSQPPPARPVLTLLANLARPPLKRDARQESLRLGWPKTSRVLKPIRPYLTKPKYFLENLRGKTNLGTVVSTGVHPTLTSCLTHTLDHNYVHKSYLGQNNQLPNWGPTRQEIRGTFLVQITGHCLAEAQLYTWWKPRSGFRRWCVSIKRRRPLIPFQLTFLHAFCCAEFSPPFPACGCL